MNHSKLLLSLGASLALAPVAQSQKASAPKTSPDSRKGPAAKTSPGSKNAPATQKTPSQAVRALVDRVYALAHKGEFAAAAQLVQTRLAKPASKAELLLLQNALADVHIVWGRDLAKQDKLKDATAHLLRAYEHDKTARLDFATQDLDLLSQYAVLQGDIKGAFSFLDNIIALAVAHDDPSWHGYALNSKGGICLNAGRYEQGIRFFSEAVPLFKKAKNPVSEAAALANIAVANQYLGRYQAALDVGNRVLPLVKQLGDRQQEGAVLSNMAGSYQALARYDEALDAYQEALKIRRELKIPGDVANTLANLGTLYHAWSRYDEALRYFDEALKIQKAIPDRSGAATTLSSKASTLQLRGQYYDALNTYKEAQALFEYLKEPQGIESCLSSIGLNYAYLGLFDDALDYYNRALPIAKAIKNPGSVASLEINIGGLYRRRGAYQEALSHFEKARAIFENIKYDKGAAATYTFIGATYADLKNFDEALKYLNRSWPIQERLGDRRDQSNTLNTLGGIYARLGRSDEAIKALQSCLTIKHTIGDLNGLASTGMSLMGLYAQKGQIPTAIVYGKQAVNAYQAIRFQIRNLDKRSQRSYLATARSTYERLASLLVSQHREEEAEQVLRFLRQEDAFEFVQRDPELAKELAALFAPLTYTAAEKQQLAPDIAATVTQGEGSEEGRQWQQALQKREEAGAGRAALVSTFNLGDAFYVLLTTAQGREAFALSIARRDFDALTARVQYALSHPGVDPRPDSQKLYNIVFCNGRLERALEAKGITTALWFTSGTLRYIPIEALYDGARYLVQKPRANVSVTLTSRQLFDGHAQGQALAAGVSLAHTMERTKGEAPLALGALTNVPGELRSIVNDPPHGGTGPLPGTILLDGDFTATSLEKGLAQGVSTVHIATHFALKPSDTAEPALLLGDGKPLPLTQWKEALKLKGVDLLTLSACETGIGTPDAGGGEVSSIGEISQYLGAQSVLVSLWPVQDASTATLMSDFYKRWHAAPQDGKAGALREAQRALLGDTPAPSTSTPNASDIARGKPLPLDPQTGETQPPPFAPDPAHPYSHPYYWAPFTLIGNWK